VPAGGSRSRIVRWIELLGWIVVACVGAVIISQTIRLTGFRLIAVTQALTPYLAMLMVPVGLIALSTRRRVMATVCAAIGLGALVLAAPLAFPDGRPAPIAGSVGLRVASVNLLYSNDRMDAVARELQRIDPDVIVFNEYTAEHQAALQAAPLAGAYLYRIDRSGLLAGGIAVWTKASVIVHEHPDTYTYSLDLTVKGPDGDVRIVAMHMPTPLNSFENWERDLGTAAKIGRDATSPTMVIGDLNSSYWHPDFRRLLDAGLVDAHTALGKGFSTSWPTGKSFPSFVQLDHALTNRGLVATEIHDVAIPGSDHRGFVVTVAPTR
jgi:endonuclease/exonuclease/phosphatase (EEP) superfamily protein YafD